MDQEKITKLIKENKWLLRQLIFLNNEVKELRIRVLKLEKNEYPNPKKLSRMGFERVEGFAIDEES